ncbi:hypothetical protein CPC08DRAFT_710733 [Agrocybe pediades]|nr:hypothetical protein CPC08DRAFT_710733 [Agrocybe pediades]
MATGVYLCTLVACIRWLVYTDEGWKIRKRIDKTLLGATLSIFFFSSLHTTLAVTTTFFNIRSLEKGPVPLEDRIPWTDVVMCTATNMAVLIVDGFLLYRCWLVCGKSVRMIIFPAFFWTGGAACTILQIYWQIVQSASISKVWTPVNMNTGPGTILTPFWGCSIAVNIYSTSVILYRIWLHVKEQTKHSAALSASVRELRFIMRVLIESGALYLMITIPHFIVWWTPSTTAILIFAWTNLPAVGSAFNLILIRTSQRRVENEKEVKYEKDVLSTVLQFRVPTLHQSTVENVDSGSSSITSVHDDPFASAKIYA